MCCCYDPAPWQRRLRKLLAVILLAGCKLGKHGADMKIPNPTIYDVAALAGVSIGTVSNFYNRPAVVALETRERIGHAVDQLKFVPNIGATLLTGKAARMIGLVLLDIGNPFFIDVARGAEEVARERDHLIVLCNSKGELEHELSYLKTLESHRVAGVLLSPVKEDSLELKRIRDRGLPIVLVGRKSKHYCCVVANNSRGGGLAGRHLIDLGHRKVAFVTGRLSLTQYRLRLKGFKAAMLRDFNEDIDVSVQETPGTGTIEEGRAVAKLLLSKRPRPTAIFCSNDLLAFGVYSGLVHAGMRIPEDISLIGYDDLDSAGFGGMNLTTIRQPKLEMGRVAAQLLLREMEEGSGHVHRHILLNPNLVIRDTTLLRDSKTS
jgi:LacI family transcriptional regulator